MTAANDDDEEEKGCAAVAILLLVEMVVVAIIERVLLLRTRGTRRWRMDDVKEKDDTHRLVETNNVESIMVTVIIVNERLISPSSCDEGLWFVVG